MAFRLLSAHRGSCLTRRTPEVEAKLAREILRYFSRHPIAADTLEGITRWRLLDERIERSLESVSRAMAWLVAEGLLVKESTALSGTIFRLNPEKRPEIEALLTPVRKRKRSRERPWR